ncbi:MAG: hypothetical protein JF603_09570 [Acidobacteria bacterium]|nr:hypothetical protein [Acidobacteriota bacterium]
MTKLRALWEKMGGRVGLAICLGGFVAIFLGWNGAAGYDRVPSQLPYLFGAIGGLGLVFIGSAMVVVEANRQQRGELKESIEAVRAALADPQAVTSPGGTRARTTATRAPATVPATVQARSVRNGAVVAGRSAFHRPDCRLLDGRDHDTELVTVAAATAEGLTACRICQPA